MEKLDLVPVFAAGNPVAVVMAKALLEAAGIPFVTKGEGVQDLLGVGRFPSGFNIATGPVQFFVAPEHADEARELLGENPLDDQS